MLRERRTWLCCRASLLISLLVAICSCSEDGPTEPEADADPTYSNIWPAEAGNYWEYDAEETIYDEGVSMYERIEDVPPIPPMEELYADLQAESPGEIEVSTRGIYRQEFTASATTSTDSTVLVLSAEMENIEGYPYPPGPMSAPYHSEEIVWTRTADRIATYAESGVAWLYLEGAITPGNEFETLLYENTYDFLLLSTRIWRTGPMELSGKTFPNAVECFYVRDEGYWTGTGPDGEASGITRFYTYGSIVYVPEIGPVYCKQRSLQLGTFESTAELRRYGRSD